MKSRVLALAPLVGLSFVMIACSASVNDGGASAESSAISKVPPPPKTDPCLTVAADATWNPGTMATAHFNSGTTAYLNDSCPSYVLDIVNPSALVIDSQHPYAQSNALVILAHDLTRSPAPSEPMCIGTQVTQRVYGHRTACPKLDCADSATGWWDLLATKWNLTGVWYADPKHPFCEYARVPGVLPTDKGYDTFRTLVEMTSPGMENDAGVRPTVNDVVDVTATNSSAGF